MKSSILLFCLLGSVSFLAQAATCEGLTGCKAKICEIENNLSAARTAGNSFKVAGLEKALSETKAHCTDEGVVKKNQEKIDEKMKDIKNTQADLAKARLKNDKAKIDKLTQKLKEKNDELNKLKE